MERGIELVQELVAALNAHDVVRVGRGYAEDYRGLDLSLGTAHHGPEDVRREFQERLQAFPDLRVTEHSLLVQHGRLAFVWTTVGTHRGTFARIPPTERRVVTCGVSFLWIKDDRIRRGLHLWDMAGMLRSMYLLPELPGAAEDKPDTLLASFFDRL